MIRPARPDDAGAIAAIYNQGIEERNATFETRPRRAADFADPRPPFLVAADDGSVRGWARVVRHSSRDCYAGVGEASIYVARDARGRGLGRALFDALAQEAEGAGYWKLVGGLFPENEASLQAVRAFRGETGVTEIRGGRRTVELSTASAMTIFFDVEIAVDSTARLAQAVDSAGNLLEANEALHELGVRTELDLEMEHAGSQE